MKNKRHSQRLFFLLAIALLFTAVNGARVPHPEQLKYPPFDWQIPSGTPYRMELPNGLRCYIAEDHALPYVSINIYVQSGTINDPRGKAGLGGLAVHCMRTCGTTQFAADTLDRILDQYAISFSLSMSETQLEIKAHFLSTYLDTALSLLHQVLFNPSFDQAKIDKEKAILIQRIEHRFDNPEPVLDAAFRKALYPGYSNSALSTPATIKAISRQDMLLFVKSVFQTQNMILSAAGDFDRERFITRIGSLFPKKNADSASVIFPAIAPSTTPTVLVVHKKISQAYVRLGLPTFKRPHPDYYALSVFNLILGGDGFTSRLGTAVRSDEGLTYSIYSNLETNYIFPASFYINFFTNVATVNKAIAITLKESAKILDSAITTEELTDAKKVLIDGMPSMFRSYDNIVDTYAWNEYYKRPADQYTAYPKKINALIRDEIGTAAQKHIEKSKFTIVIVADTALLFKAPPYDSFSVRDLKNVRIISPEELYK